MRKLIAGITLATAGVVSVPTAVQAGFSDCDVLPQSTYKIGYVFCSANDIGKYNAYRAQNTCRRTFGTLFLVNGAVHNAGDVAYAFCPIGTARISSRAVSA